MKMKAVLVSVFAVILGTAAGVCMKNAQSVTAFERLFGDIDGDGMVNAVDASMILNHYALISVGNDDTSWHEPNYAKAGDSLVFTGDGSWNLHSSPDEKSEITAKIAKGDKITVREVSDGWLTLDSGMYLSYNPTLFEKVTVTATTTQTTVTTNAQSTARPVVTQTQVIGRELVIEDIATKSTAFSYFAQKLQLDMYQNRQVECGYENGYTDGARECYLLLAILNEGQISDDVLREAFHAFSPEEINTFKSSLTNFALVKRDLGSDVHFEDYIINDSDNELANFIKSLYDAADDGTIRDEINRIWMEDQMPECFKSKPAAVTAALLSYDMYYNNNELVEDDYAYEELINPAVNELIEKAYGKS